MTDPESTPTAHHEPAASSWAMPQVRDLAGKKLGDFEVERLLGLGGMGEVYLARQLSLDRQVALKVLKTDLLSNPTYLSRFESEAWTAAKLNHPNIVHIYSLGLTEGVRYIAMEYVQGTNLREYINKKGTPELLLALSIMKQAAVALAAAGEIGLVHRDIKPENLLLTKKGQVKVADFGLARLPESDKLHLTQPGVTLGTPLYMSPEQAQGHALDHRSDLYSLGVTYYHMLAGFPPFRGESGLALALKHVREQPVSLEVHRPDLPKELVQLVMKLMAKPPANRYQTAQEMLKDLSRIREAASAAATAANPAISAAGTPVLAETAPAASKSQPRVSIRERIPSLQLDRRALFALGLVGLLVGALLGWMGRATDLLSPSAPRPTSLPGLWIDDWRAVPKLASAEDQYHHALLRASSANRGAAWLAVPGNFGGADDWTSKSYVQLARHLFRHHDRESLLTLGAELQNNAKGKDYYKDLATVTGAAAEALEGTSDSATKVFYALKDLGNQNQLSLTDPALIELMLEVTTTAAKKSPKPARSSDSEGLRKLYANLVKALQIEPGENPGRPGGV